ncbi:MAG: DnaB-like helicase C-terminal domain-containing protein [Dehalococcoidia bacterium]
MGVHGRAVSKEPCPACGSRNNLAVYEDGYKKCFGISCGHWESERDGTADSRVAGAPGPRTGRHRDVHGGNSMIEVTYEALTKRKISAETCRRFKYGCGLDRDGNPVQVADYAGVQKLRTPEKEFVWLATPPGTLFGQHLWRPQKRLVVTEGEIDALSYAEAVDCKWPVVSVPNGAQGAARSIKENLEWVSAFEEVIFLFDMDDAGQKAAAECAALLKPGTALIGNLARKDANAVLCELGSGELYNTVFKAKPWSPACIVEGSTLLEDILKVPERGMEYPFTELNELTYGQRLDEMVVWVAGTGVGKSALVREVAFHNWKTHGQRVGIIALEEATAASAKAMVSLEMEKRLHLPPVRETVTNAEIEAASEVLEGFVFYDHWGSVEADDLLPKIRFMAVSLGIKWFVLDHLSIMVSGQAAEGDERKRLDQLVTQLRTLISELHIHIDVVSHLRKAKGTAHEEGGQISIQDIRSSGAPGQLGDIIVAAERDLQAEGANANVTTLRVLKNRFSGQTGVAGAVKYNHDTGRLLPSTVEGEDDGTSHF